MVSLEEMQRKLALSSLLTATITIVLVAIFAAPQSTGLAGAGGNTAPSQGSSAIVYQWIIPTTTKVTLSLIDPKATPMFTITLYGCWLPLEGDLIVGITDQARGGNPLNGPNIIQGDWSSSPFYMVVKDSQVVKVKTSNPDVWVPAYGTIDWDAGTITVESAALFNAVAVKFSIKQPPIHSCNTLPNL